MKDEEAHGHNETKYEIATLSKKTRFPWQNQVSIRQATSLKDIKSDIIKLQNAPQTQNQIGFMFLFIVIDFYAVHSGSQLLLSEVVCMYPCVLACVCACYNETPLKWVNGEVEQDHRGEK